MSNANDIPGFTAAQDAYDNAQPGSCHEGSPEDCEECEFPGDEFVEVRGEYVCPVCKFQEDGLTDCETCGGSWEQHSYNSEQHAFVCAKCGASQDVE